MGYEIGYPIPHTLLQKPLRKLLQALVPILRSLRSYRLDVSSQGRVPPVVAGRLLSVARNSFARGLE